MSRGAAAWAGFLITLLVAFFHVSVALAQPKASPPDIRRARALFEEGVALVDEGKWADALAAFQKSDTINPSASARLNIGATMRALGRYVEAKRILEKILEDAKVDKRPLKPSTKKDVERLLKEVTPKILTVSLQVTPPDGDVQMDGAPITIALDGKLSVDPGTHVFVVQGAGYETATITQTLTTSGATVTLVAPKIIPKITVVKETPFYARAWFIATAAVAVAGGATVGIIFATRPKEGLPAGPPMNTVGVVIPAAVRF